jgi:hypothetical protein
MKRIDIADSPALPETEIVTDEPVPTEWPQVLRRLRFVLPRCEQIQLATHRHASHHRYLAITVDVAHCLPRSLRMNGRPLLTFVAILLKVSQLLHESMLTRSTMDLTGVGFPTMIMTTSPDPGIGRNSANPQWAVDAAPCIEQESRDTFPHWSPC